MERKCEAAICLRTSLTTARPIQISDSGRRFVIGQGTLLFLSATVPIPNDMPMIRSIGMRGMECAPASILKSAKSETEPIGVIVLSLCDRTGNMVQPWIEAGYEAITVDLQDSPTANPARHHFVADVTTWRYPLKFGPPSIVFAFPPCTHLAVSGARWFKDKGLPALIEGLTTVNACREICEASGAPWMLENPVGTLASYWREPDFTFDPCDYGDPYTKKTCLWVGGGFIMPPKINQGDMFAPPTTVAPTMGSMIHRMPPSDDRGDLRSITPMGFARAVLRANGTMRRITVAS